jgi:hypothetical protein
MTRDELDLLLRRVKEWVERSVIVLLILHGIAYCVNTYTPYRIPEFWISAGLAGAVGLAVLWITLAWIVRRIKGILGRGITERYAKRTEVDEVLRVCRGFYDRDDHVINRDSLDAFMQANSRTAKLFYKDGQAVGVYIVFSINRDAVRKFLDRTFMDAQHLNARHAVNDRGKPAGLYVTNIAARGTSAKGLATQSLMKDLEQRTSQYRSITHVFGRMANKDGARLIRKSGFEKIEPNLHDEQVWQYRVTARRFLEPVS